MFLVDFEINEKNIEKRIIVLNEFNKFDFFGIFLLISEIGFYVKLNLKLYDKKGIKMVDVVFMIIVKILFFVDILENILLNVDENDVENEGENFKCSVILFLVMSFYGMVLWW